MPVYEYECQDNNCKSTWECEQKISDPVLDHCPKCNKQTAKRLISGGTGFQLVGGGWYKDGYSKK